MNATFSVLLLLLPTALHVLAQDHECKDTLSLCKQFIRLRQELGLTRRQTCSEYWSRKFCKGTCGLCRKIVRCDRTRYGCCWDNVTPRSKSGECPVCKNIYQSFCPRFKTLCKKWSDTRDGLGARFRRACPVTCSRCIEGQTFFKRRRFHLI